MTPHDPHENFFRELDRLERERAEAQRRLGEAEAIFAPAPRPSPGPVSRRPAVVIVFQASRPDRWVTMPIWALWVTALHLVVTLLTLGALAFGTALLIFLGRVIDSVIGVPLATFGAGALGLLAAGGTFLSIVRSFREQITRCPW